MAAHFKAWVPILLQSGLAAAYGIAVTGTMTIDSILAFAVMFSLWRWKPWTAPYSTGPAG
jgi:K+ transporter